MILSAGLAERVGEVFGVQLPTDEILLIAMFLCYEPPVSRQGGSPVILFAFYGRGIAEAVVGAIAGLTHLENVFPFELALTQDETKTYGELKSRIEEIHQGRGVYVVYDGESLPGMLDEIAEESGILIRQFPAPVVTMGIELARKALPGADPDRVYQEAMLELRAFTVSRGDYIVTLCATGQGGAEELKSYLERYGMLGEIQVIPMAMSDRAVLREAFRRLLRTGTILCGGNL